MPHFNFHCWIPRTGNNTKPKLKQAQRSDKNILALSLRSFPYLISSFIRLHLVIPCLFLTWLWCTHIELVMRNAMTLHVKEGMRTSSIQTPTPHLKKKKIVLQHQIKALPHLIAGLYYSFISRNPTKVAAGISY